MPAPSIKINPENPVVRIDVEGYDVVIYEIRINDQVVKTAEVNFGDGQTTTEIKVP
jgi:hypothetical protein